ncbi:hypothetical protein ACIA5D_17080 [Actinoplanes sp. NPDC051513]|uniref:hypothetical protein n=1 Tax=Actinoplanes sp. NPDC051513 TaxID=3363908 RepID=UPI00378DC1AC
MVIGRLGSLWGTLWGGMVLGVAQTVGATIDPQYSILAGHLVFLVVLASPPGRSLLGLRREGRRLWSLADDRLPFRLLPVGYTLRPVSIGP